MAGFIATKVGKHILKENVQNRFGTEDPYFDYTTHNNNNNKTIKTKKPPPPGLTPLELKVLKKVTRRAYRLDNCFSICGMRIGWGAIFGFIPGLGDVFDAFMAVMVYHSICQLDVPATLKGKMVMNIVLDFAVGLVPILGDVADAVFKANTRNVGLLYGYLRERGVERSGKGNGNGNGGGGGDVEAGHLAIQQEQKQQQQQHTVTSAGKNGANYPLVSPVSQHQQQQQQRTGLTSPPPPTHHSTSAIKGHHTPGQISGTTPITSLPAVAAVNTHEKTTVPSAQPTEKSRGGWFSRFTDDGKGGGGGSVLKKATKTKMGEPGDVDVDVDVHAGRRI